MSKKEEFLDYKKHGYPYQMTGDGYLEDQRPTTSPLFDWHRKNKVIHYSKSHKNPFKVGAIIKSR